jgi:hypothetical protein
MEEAFMAAEPKEFVEPTIVSAIQNAKAKNARLRLMKERNEHYLAEHRGEDGADDEFLYELGISSAE